MGKNNRKTALVLGSSHGVGAAIAQELRDAGFDAPVISSKNINTADKKSVLAFAKNNPFIARLSDSVPLPVNMISSFFAPISSATFCRDSSIAFLACLPIVYRLDGLPNFSEK